MTPRDAGILQRLVLCMCGHSLDFHGAAGCAGDRRRVCGCPRDAETALETAVEQARTEPWRLWAGAEPEVSAP